MIQGEIQKAVAGVMQSMEGQALQAKVQTAEINKNKALIDLQARMAELEGGNIWNINKERGPREIVRISDETKRAGFQEVGTLVIEGRRGAKRVTERTGCFAE